MTCGDLFGGKLRLPVAPCGQRKGRCGLLRYFRVEVDSKARHSGGEKPFMLR